MPYDYTQVAVERSQAEIRRLLSRFNVEATRFTSFPAYALLEFVRRDPDGNGVIPYRITVQPKVGKQPRNTQRELDRAEKQVWRVVYYWLKSKLEAIQFGLLEFEQEFLPHMLLADGRGREETVDKVFFERLAGRLGSPDDPFGGLRPALPSGE